MTDTPEELRVVYKLTEDDLRASAKHLIARTWGGLLAPLVRLAGWLAVRNVVREARDSGLLAVENEVRITRDGVLQKTKGVKESRVEWKAVHAVDATERLILIFITENLAHVIPRSAFASAAEATRFLDRARAWHEEARRA